MNKFVFLDRDGVINRKIENGYVTKYEEFIFEREVKETLRGLHANGFQVIVITNQQCIGKKILTQEKLAEIHKKMSENVKKSGGEILDIFVCPHLASDNCDCRKPKPGMLLQAAKKYNIQLGKTFFIGDSLTDVQAGKAAGTKTIFLKPMNEPEKLSSADATFENLGDAINYVIWNS